MYATMRIHSKDRTQDKVFRPSLELVYGLSDGSVSVLPCRAAVTCQVFGLERFGARCARCDLVNHRQAAHKTVNPRHPCCTVEAPSVLTYRNPFLESFDSQSRPSSPSPEVAHVAMYQLRRRECNPSLSVISAAFIALGKSCLFAKTRRTASRSSSSFNMRASSSRASAARSLSLESTTKISPCVFWKCLQSGRILSCPPTSHTVKLIFLYSTVSTLKPMVGMVVTISPSLSLYRMVVLPAASKPTMRMRISFLEKRRLNTDKLLS
eukprot:28172_3